MLELLAIAGLATAPGVGGTGPAVAATPAAADAAVPSRPAYGARDVPPSPADTTPLASRRDREVPDSLRGTIRGRVRGRESGEPLPFVVVEVGGGDRYKATRTGRDGRYVLENVPVGRLRLRARALDRRPLELTVRVPPRKTVHLDLRLGLRPVGLPLLRVLGLASGGDGDLRNSERLTPGSPAAAELRALEASPGVAELGLAEEVQPSPGSGPADPSSTLYVRGGTSNLKMVLLDGAPVYAPFHLGGLMDALQPGIVDSSRVYVGGAPARYNGGLSYIMDLRTRPGRPEETSARGAVDLLGARTQVEGPLGPGSYYVGARGLHGLGSEGLVGGPLPYGYGDALARVDMPFSENDRVAVTGFLNRESVELDPEVGFEGSAHWGNRAGSIRYRHRSEKGEVRVVASAGRFGTRLPVGDEPVQASEGHTTRTRLSLDAKRRIDGVQLQAGASFDHYGVGYAPGPSRQDASFSPERRASGDMMGGYGEVTFSATEALSVRAGLRTDLFLPEFDGRLSPRLTAALDLGASSVLSVTAGRYHQYVRSPAEVLEPGLGAFTPGSEGSGTLERDAVRTDLKVADASHLVVGLDHRPRDGLRLGAEGFFKAFRNVPRSDALRSSGLNLWVDYRGDRWAAWGGYGLAFVWSRTPGEERSDEFVGRHLFSGGLRAPLPSEVRLEVQVATSAGLPLTPLPTPVEPATPERGGSSALGSPQASSAGDGTLLAGGPQGSYLRLDVKLSRSWPLHVLGSDIQLTPYVQVLNALDRRDALFYQFEQGSDLEPRALSSVPLLPVAGIEWHL